VNIQFSQQHLLKRLSFVPSRGFDAFVKNWMSVAVWDYFGVLYSIPLGLHVCFYASTMFFVVVVTMAPYYNLKLGIVTLPPLVLFSGCIWLFGVFLCFHSNFMINFFYFYEEWQGVLMDIALNL
jgi:hypothetical protein